MNIDDVKKQFGLRVQFFRKQKGYTQEKLGELVGISTEQVSNMNERLAALVLKKLLA